jgi:hypothetical protein
MGISRKQGIKFKNEFLFFLSVRLNEDFHQRESGCCRIETTFFYVSEKRVAKIKIAWMTLNKIDENTCIKIDLAVCFEEVFGPEPHQDLRSF